MILRALILSLGMLCIVITTIWFVSAFASISGATLQTERFCADDEERKNSLSALLLTGFCPWSRAPGAEDDAQLILGIDHPNCIPDFLLAATVREAGGNIDQALFNRVLGGKQCLSFEDMANLKNQLVSQ